ncbi:MAG: response regulator transcription factor [Cryomorphaceae bacterium]|nr:response regulator transcription factor [Cryomorphaceae bacterium]
MSTKKLNVFLTDDHAILMDGVKTILDKQSNLTVVGTAENAEKTIEQLENQEVDLLITDFNLPDMDGLQLVKKVKMAHPQIKIIVLSMHDESRIVRSILKEGVEGYLLKSDSHYELLKAIECIVAGEIFLSKQVNQIIVNALKYPDEDRLLTDREREIVKLIAEDLSNKQIAQHLFISERTVETHRKNILKKTGTNTAVGLLKFAYANGILT